MSAEPNADLSAFTRVLAVDYGERRIGLAVSDPTLSDADVGGPAFRVTVTFNEAIDTSTTPVIAFTPSVATTLSFTGGVWSLGNTVYIVGGMMGGDHAASASVIYAQLEP